ncbi:hypothetical protein ACFY0F_23720 [Streptomyces sp. NPDC001544]|uniref:hypothetical protein n=1 Tax=Streptomyces sp. NPDC001544 TaxID=3364584 RepID=UPI0036BD2F95
MNTPLTGQQIAQYEAAVTAYQQHVPTGFACCSAHPAADAAAALLAEVRRLRAELAAERERYTAGLRRADDHVNAMSEELKRYADGKEQPVLWSVYNAMHSRAATAEGRVAELERQAATPRTITESEYSRAWHAIEGAAGEEGADPGTVLNAVLRALGIDAPAAVPAAAANEDGDQ